MIIIKLVEGGGILVVAVELKWQSFAHAYERTIQCLPQALVQFVQHTLRHGSWIIATQQIPSVVTSAIDATVDWDALGMIQIMY